MLYVTISKLLVQELVEERLGEHLINGDDKGVYMHYAMEYIKDVKGLTIILTDDLASLVQEMPEYWLDLIDNARENGDLNPNDGCYMYIKDTEEVYSRMSLDEFGLLPSVSTLASYIISKGEVDFIREV